MFKLTCTEEAELAGAQLKLLYTEEELEAMRKGME